jgi:hypothetical protein
MDLPQKLPVRSKKCSITQTPFQPGDAYVSQMIFEHDQWQRRDFTPDAWGKVEEKGEFWVGKIPLKEEKKQDRSPLALFLKRHKENSFSPIVFLLALYLERQKVLHYRPGLAKAPSRCYEEPISGELFCVTPTALSSDKEREVLTELEGLLEKTPTSV